VVPLEDNLLPFLSPPSHDLISASEEMGLERHHIGLTMFNKFVYDPCMEQLAFSRMM